MDASSLLAQAGLDQHEIALYLALVPLREGTAGQLAKKSGVPRTYAYRVLDSLQQKGFIQDVSTSPVRRYRPTDFSAAQRYLERRQLELYKAQQEAQKLSVQLENLAHPDVPSAGSSDLRDVAGEEDFWRLLHSTITREVWVVNPPLWWGDGSHSKEVQKWEQYRQKQHIWEKRFLSSVPTQLPQFTEAQPFKSAPPNSASFFLVDQYQVQISSWAPFRALRVESQEIVEVLKTLLE
ncbi:MAG: helix-turn-helix domain-containing protein [bacterium]|nr:helix-turn-helix domain-containing protein [bacterium]